MKRKTSWSKSSKSSKVLKPLGINSSARRKKHIEFTEQYGKIVCTLIAEGYSLRDIALAPNMPSTFNVFHWLYENEQFVEQYDRAQATRMFAMAEEIVEISDSSNEDNVNCARLRVETRKWLMSKLNPRRFGDNVGREQQPLGPVLIQWVGEQMEARKIKQLDNVTDVEDLNSKAEKSSA